jgi:hypothetical protein
MKQTATAALAAALALLALSPARAGDAPARREFHHSYPLAANGSVDIDDDRGDIHVVGWDANRVQVDAKLCAPTSRALATMNVTVESSPTAVTVETVFPRESFTLQSWWQLLTADRCGSGMEVDYVVHVPTHAHVRLTTKSGDIDAHALAAVLSARSASGDIQAQDVGDATLSTVSGDVTVTHGRGVCDVDETSGRTMFRDVTGSISSSSVSGDVDLDRVTGKAVITTTSGSITAHAYRGVARLRSVSGSIELTLVRGDGVSISASTVSGEIESDVPLRLQSPLDVQTVSGDITARFI